MGEVYRDTGQEAVRIQAEADGKIQGVCQAIIVPARRGRHLAVPYGPVLADVEAFLPLLEELRRIAQEAHCRFIRLSPFWPDRSFEADRLIKVPGSVEAPLHLLGEHVWYLPLVASDPWNDENTAAGSASEEELLKNMRQTTRNLIRRAERDGVTVEASPDPNRDIEFFLKLHEQTRRRHGFTPYSDTFFRSQVKRFSARGECTLYLARYEGEVLAASVHMHTGGETSYHHGASAPDRSKIPASQLLQWTAIRDALRRGDRIYSFWGIAPVALDPDGKWRITHRGQQHPFAGVTTFKTGFGGKLLNLVHCRDIPLTPAYRLTRAIETIRKWRRGF